MEPTSSPIRVQVKRHAPSFPELKRGMVHGIREYWRARPGQELGTIMEHYAMCGSEPHYQSRCRETTLLCFKKHDSDGDGLKDIITGKRFWAHGPTGDAEPNAAPYTAKSAEECARINRVTAVAREGGLVRLRVKAGKYHLQVMNTADALHAMKETRPRSYAGLIGVELKWESTACYPESSYSPRSSVSCTASRPLAHCATKPGGKTLSACFSW